MGQLLAQVDKVESNTSGIHIRHCGRKVLREVAIATFTYSKVLKICQYKVLFRPGTEYSGYRVTSKIMGTRCYPGH